MAGLYYDFQGRGYINQPLIDDTLALRVAGYYSRRDGWDVNGFNPFDPEGAFDYWREPMTFHADRHAVGEKRVLGVSIPDGTPGDEALQRALDAVFAHPMVDS